MKPQSRSFRQVLLVTVLLCFGGGSAFVTWQWARHPKRTRRTSGGGKIVTTFRRWSPADKLWLRVGYIQLGVGTALATFLFATRNPYRYIESAAKPLMEFSNEDELSE